MAEVVKSIRLKAATVEFNQSIDHIVAFLKKKGIDIASDPNTKVTAEAYALLQNEFQSDKAIRKEAEKISQSKVKKEEAVVDAEKKVKPVVERDEEPAEIRIKSNLVSAEPKKEKPKKK